MQQVTKNKNKGFAWERDIAKQLSNWARPEGNSLNVFRRSPASQSVAGVSGGDITAGACNDDELLFLRCCYIELKVGKDYANKLLRFFSTKKENLTKTALGKLYKNTFLMSLKSKRPCTLVVCKATNIGVFGFFCCNIDVFNSLFARIDLKVFTFKSIIFKNNFGFVFDWDEFLQVCVFKEFLAVVKQLNCG